MPGPSCGQRDATATTAVFAGGPYCLYPPLLSSNINVTEGRDSSDKLVSYVISLPDQPGRPPRYFKFGPREYSLFTRFSGDEAVTEIAARCGGSRAVPVIQKFLSKLDSLGLLERGGQAQEVLTTRSDLYRRIKILDPDRFLAWTDRKVGWLFRGAALGASVAFLVAAVICLLASGEEVVAYTSYSQTEYGLVAILMIGLLIAVSHEMAHGLACKHFGGTVNEAGVLMIYYVLPAFYCNVSDIYRLRSRRERLWVISAGIYWQAIVSAVGGVVWLVANPYTAIADAAFLVFLGGSLNLLINCNPLIKLDGYYALCQMSGITNLQKKSFDYVRSLITILVSGSEAAADRKSQHARPALLLAYCICSIAYSVALVWIILDWAGTALMNWFGLAGAILTIILAALLTRKLWRPGVRRIRLGGEQLLAHLPEAKIRIVKPLALLTGGRLMSDTSEQTALQRTDRPALVEGHASALAPGNRTAPVQRRWRPRVVKTSFALLAVVALMMPWEASTGSDCSLELPPGRESAARAGVDAVLTEVFVQPGDVVAEGAKIARLGDPQMEDRLTQLNAEITRLTTDASRIEEELRVRSELILSASFKEKERQQIANELRSERRQISSDGRNQSGDQSSASGRVLPASLAVLQSDIELKEIELSHSRLEAERYKTLLDQGLIGSQQYDTAVNTMKIAEKELQRSRARLEAALTEHRRTTASAETDSLVAETEARAARSNFDALIAELHANRQEIESLRHRRDILQREYDGMNVAAPRAGVILGEDLRKLVGRRYSRGDEIVRIGELGTFLLRVDVNEREIANVRLDSPVRFKLKTLPGRVFTGQVSKINAEPTVNQQGQRFYPVEVSVENSDGLLRPGMSGFARISIGRQALGLTLAQKVWHALRPELWLF
ncbi:MAG TPA: efflux RND transporter periplasmic adaptor subunit [Blastocatellia bacterium]|nr:efflux RND transporter periplasmic adaptor subunit [Blastocatellia bacterium]